MSFRVLLCTVVLCLALTGQITPACGTQYVVDQNHPDKSDDNPGTETKPLRTISAGAARVAPGDTILVRDGVYRETVGLPGQEGADLGPVSRARELPVVEQILAAFGDRGLARARPGFRAVATGCPCAIVGPPVVPVTIPTARASTITTVPGRVAIARRRSRPAPDHQHHSEHQLPHLHHPHAGMVPHSS